MNQDFYPETDSNHEKIFEIAKCQRQVLLCILAHIGVTIAYKAAPDKYTLTILFIGFAVFIGIVFFVFQLAKRLYSTGIAVLFSIASFIPFIGFLILLNVNYSATKAIQAKGYDVGLMGAKLDQFK